MQLRISSAPGTAAVCPGIATHTLASGAARSRMRLVRQYSPLPCGPGRGSTVGSRGAGEGGVATVVSLKMKCVWSVACRSVLPALMCANVQTQYPFHGVRTQFLWGGLRQGT